MTNRLSDECPICGGRRQPGSTTFAAELGFGVVVIRNVPAIICSQCGADWIADEHTARIERTVEEARRKKSQVEVSVFS